MRRRMKADIWMPFYIGDYLRDTMFLRREHHGSYLLLIMAYWTNGGPLPADDETLMEIAKCKISEWATTKALLESFFVLDQGRWRHERIDEELERAKCMAESLSERGKLGAYERWKNAKENATANATANAQALLADAPSPSPVLSLSEKPSWTEFWEFCKIHGLGAEWFARDKFLAAEADNWKNKPNWTAYAARCRAWWENAGRPMFPVQIKGQPPPKRKETREEEDRRILREAIG